MKKTLHNKYPRTVLSSVLLFIVIFVLIVPDIVYATTDVTAINQRHYRWRADDGDETSTGAAFLENANTPRSGLVKNTTIRLRVEIDNTGTAATGNQTYDVLQYSTDAGGACGSGNWTTIPLSATTEHWQISTSQLTDKGGTTDHGFSTHQNSTFLAGKQVENPAAGGNYNINLANTDYTHMEYALIATSNATDGQTYYIRPIRGGIAVLASYVQCATITIAAAAATISCSTDISSTSFGSMDSSSVFTSSPNASTTISCSGTASGCTLYVKDAGGGGSPGLWNSASSVLIPSPNAAFSATSTLAAGTEGYGVQATTTAPGLAIAARYNQTGDTVGGLVLSDTTLASSTADISSSTVGIVHKAAVSANTLSGAYNDTITYSCVAN